MVNEEVRQQLATQLPVPGKFDGANGRAQTELCAKWAKRLYHTYRVASGLHAESQREQVNTWLCAMGDFADAKLTTLKIDENKASYAEVKTAIDQYFNATKNIVERARFNVRRQTTTTPVIM